MSNREPTRHTESFLVWCGREGFLTILEMMERTDRDIEAYAKMQPLRFRSAVSFRGYDGARIYHRTRLWSIKEQKV